MAASEKIFNLLDTKEFIEVPRTMVPPAERLAEVEFQNVSLVMVKTVRCSKISHLKFTLAKKLRLVGPTGAGKTTIISLLLRFYDQYTGRILINGVDIKEIPEEQLRRDIAVVFQDAFLFSRSVMENLTFDRPEITEERVHSVSKYLLAEPFIQQLPKGYQELLAERGSNLSFGQRQLMTFVRALAADPSIVILDEATSSVDVETEYVIRNSLQRLMHSRTAILIAHRLSTIQNVDRIFVLLDGELREEGTHQELLTRGGLYSKLYQLQYKEQELEQQVRTKVRDP